MNAFIPKAKASAYTRWEAERFDAPPLPPSEPSPPAPEEPPEEELPLISLPTAEELEAIHQQAHAEGYQTGYQSGFDEGRQAGLAEIQAQADQLAAWVQEIQASLTEFDQEMADAVLACALEVAGHLTKTTLSVRPELLIPIIREALSLLPLHHGPVTLLIHPQDEALITEHLGDQFHHAGWRLMTDDSIEPGGCKLRSGATTIDASLPTRWRRALEAIGVSAEWLDTQP